MWIWNTQHGTRHGHQPKQQQDSIQHNESNHNIESMGSIKEGQEDHQKGHHDRHGFRDFECLRECCLNAIEKDIMKRPLRQIDSRNERMHSDETCQKG